MNKAENRFYRQRGDRSFAEIAVEFGEYMAKAAEHVMQSPPRARADNLRALRSAIYEFRKRAAKCNS